MQRSKVDLQLMPGRCLKAHHRRLPDQRVALQIQAHHIGVTAMLH
jgi:hypothetical protein